MKRKVEKKQKKKIGNNINNFCPVGENENSFVFAYSVLDSYFLITWCQGTLGNWNKGSVTSYTGRPNLLQWCQDVLLKK